jgi:hypothetical protein
MEYQGRCPEHDYKKLLSGTIDKWLSCGPLKAEVSDLEPLENPP